MKIQNHYQSKSFYVGNSINGREQNAVKNDENKTTKSIKNNNISNILAADLNMNQQDSVLTKQIKGQKDAIRTLLNQFTNDKLIDDDLKSRKQRMIDLDIEIAISQEEIRKLEKNKQQVKESFGVTDDSEEQKNLELLEKERDSKKIGSKIKLTKEEKKKLSTIGTKTEYQKEILNYDSMQDEWNYKIEVAKKEKIIENETIKSIKKELLKIHPMVDATNEAENILKATNDEIIGMLIDEAKDHVDEAQEKIEEKAKEEAKNRAEQDAIKEEIKEKTTEKNATLKISNSEDGDSNGSNSKKIQSSDSVSIENMSLIQKAVSEQHQLEIELKNLVVNQKLTMDDSKGIIVDELL